MRPWSWKRPRTKQVDTSVVSIKELDPQKSTRRLYLAPTLWAHELWLIAFWLWEAKRNKTANTDNIKPGLHQLFWLNLIRVLLLFCHTGSNPEPVWSFPLGELRSMQQKQMKHCVEHLYKTRVFIYSMHPIILCHSSTPPKTTETLAGDSAFKKNLVLSDRPHNNRFT